MGAREGGPLPSQTTIQHPAPQPARPRYTPLHLAHPTYTTHTLHAGPNDWGPIAAPHTTINPHAAHYPPACTRSFALCSFSANLDAPAASIAVARNQTLVDSAVLDLSADGNTAEDDENGCAASFPGATYAIRLIFSSGVRDRDAAGALVPLGADPSAARANELFTLESDAGDEIIGQADADGDNYADVCVRGAGGARGAAVLTVTCAEGAAVTAPDGVPCSTPIVRFQLPPLALMCVFIGLHRIVHVK